ncbi:MAG: HAMP domain-containing histidine kinase [Chlorobi bacterium]|nr:HAMP domain-containing histidine kinase [Chlorobiota bacterium]
MNIYHTKKKWKLFLLIGAITISALTLWYTQNLVEQLKEQERQRMALWAEAMREMTLLDVNASAPSFISDVIINNNTIPVILVDDSDTILYYRNIDVSKNREKAVLQKKLNKMKADSSLFVIDLGGGEKQYLYYGDSILIKQLSWFPFVQLFIVSIFVFVAYLAFSGARKAEQDQVWAGMAKETAHQLGTPTSSLLGWIDVLKMKHSDDELLTEMNKDVKRLQTITDRFSKIGSKPEMKKVPLNEIIVQSTEYLKKRTSNKIEFNIETPDEPVIVNLSPVLFEWALENISKNAIDASQGKGSIKISLKKYNNQAIIDITDNGKGISKSNFKAIFQPGYTTKQRGWGLGLTLTKRIIEQYHGGKIFVKESEIGKGTTIRIILPSET